MHNIFKKKKNSSRNNNHHNLSSSNGLRNPPVISQQSYSSPNNHVISGKSLNSSGTIRSTNFSYQSLNNHLINGSSGSSATTEVLNIQQHHLVGRGSSSLQKQQKPNGKYKVIKKNLLIFFL